MIKARLLSALEKVFENKAPKYQPECCRLTALHGEYVSFQVAFWSDEDVSANVKVSSDLGKKVSVRTVEYVPVRFPGYPEAIEKDQNYLTTEKGRYPDYLHKIRGGKIRLKKNKYHTLWLEIDVSEKVKAGDHEIRVSLENENGEELCAVTQLLTVYNASLPKTNFVHTEWFHTDCIADYYGYTVWDEKHWAAIEKFMATAVKRGINMILTPVFTPPLDTQVGGERTTVQLVDVNVNGGKYSFGFEKLHRWAETAKRVGVEYFEISHLFTQWGATCAPKVMATVDGEYKRIFGWDTTVEEGIYPQFLNEFLPALVAELKAMGIAERCYFHVSDEPSMEHLENYRKAKNIIAPHIQGFKIVDALSKIDFYDTGAVEIPIPSSDHIEPFLERDIGERWTYYCCGQGVDCSNRYMSMSLARTRALGVQMFKYNIVGFLQWGYNFYNTRFSIEHINPYKITDAGSEDGISIPPAFPSGDAFVVYPGSGGEPEESIRLLAFYNAQTDLRALKALAEKTSYEHVMELIEGELDFSITFKNYPHSEHYYIQLRNRVNRELEKK